MIWQTRHKEMLCLVLVILERKSGLLIPNKAKSYTINKRINNKQLLLKLHLFLSGGEGYRNFYLIKLCFILSVKLFVSR